jgi:hypothetical protein
MQGAMESPYRGRGYMGKGRRVKGRVCIHSWSLLCLLTWTPISIMPSLTTTVARSHNTRILCIVFTLRWLRCGARRLKISMLDLMLWSFKSLLCILHPFLLTRTKNKSLRRKTITELLVVSGGSSVPHLPLALHNYTSVFQD